MKILIRTCESPNFFVSLQKRYVMVRLTTEQFIEEARSIHRDKYDYSKVEYKNNSIKVCIICPTHGEFWQTPHGHLAGQGCSKCKFDKLKFDNALTTEQFIEKAKQMHGELYDYSKVEYKGSHEKVCIICPIHGEFWQIANDHLNGKGCKFCNHRSFKYDLAEFKKMANIVHNNKYDYSKVNYTNIKTKICIICPTHGEFWQTPHNHLNGQGCESCKNIKLENVVRTFLEKSKTDFTQHKHFEWLGRQSLDFYIPSKNIAVECQGIQHFKPIEHFGGEEEFTKNVERDKRKKMLCEEHGIKLLYYSNLKIEYPYEVFEDLDKLLEEIKHS